MFPVVAIAVEGVQFVRPNEIAQSVDGWQVRRRDGPAVVDTPQVGTGRLAAVRVVAVRVVALGTLDPRGPAGRQRACDRIPLVDGQFTRLEQVGQCLTRPLITQSPQFRNRGDAVGRVSASQRRQVVE